LPAFLRFLFYRFLSIPITLLVVTLLLYGTAMLTPVEVRAELYMPPLSRQDLSEERIAALKEVIIRRYRLDDPFPIQYALWLGNLLHGDWGYSQVLGESVLPALLRRTPVTVELTLFSLLGMIPLGLLAGILAGERPHSAFDRRLRLTAFLATSMPTFILALVLLALFYVGVRWFPPERLGLSLSFVVKSPEFLSYTGLLTIDGLLNRRPDVTLDALRHLVLPVFTLSLTHWATLARVTRISLIEEMQKDYVIAGRARGLNQRRLVWRHAFRNTIAPALTSSSLSAAALVTGVYVVEVIFNFHGLSEILVRGMQDVPDAAATLGFALYSVTLVLVLMFILDVLQAVFDPRIRAGVLAS
jgi:peptide/nickel transport system permease protein